MNYLDRIVLARKKEELEKKVKIENNEKQVSSMVEKLKPYCPRVMKILEIVKSLDDNNLWKYKFEDVIQEGTVDIGDIFICLDSIGINTDKSATLEINDIVFINQSVEHYMSLSYRKFPVETLINDKHYSNTILEDGQKFLEKFDNFEKNFYSKLEEFLVSKGV